MKWSFVAVLIVFLLTNCASKKGQEIVVYHNGETLCSGTIPQQFAQNVGDDKLADRITEKLDWSVDAAGTNMNAGTATIHICVGQKGNPIYAEIAQQSTTISDLLLLKRMLSKAMRQKYAADKTAPAVECGIQTIEIAATQ